MRITQHVLPGSSSMRWQWHAPRLRRTLLPPHAASGFRFLSAKRLLIAKEPEALPGDNFNPQQYLIELVQAAYHSCIASNAGATVHAMGIVPPCFSQRQRSVIRGVIELAGFERVKLVDDTMAVLLGNRACLPERGSVLVYSWGASAFSVASYQVNGTTIRPISLEGDRELGVDDIDSDILNLALSIVASDCAHGLDSGTLSFDIFEQARYALDEGERVHIELPMLKSDRAVAPDTLESVCIEPAAYRELFDRRLSRTLALVTAVVDGLPQKRCDALILSGAMARASAVRRALRNYCDGNTVVARDDSTVLGAAQYASMIPCEEWIASLKRHERDDARVNDEQEGKAAARPEQDRAKRDAVDYAPSWNAMVAPLLAQAEELENKGELDAAAAIIERAGKTMNAIFSLVFFKAAERKMAQRKVEEALRAVTEANRLDPRNEHIARMLSEWCADLAREYAQRGKLDACIELLRKARHTVEGLGGASEQGNALLASFLYREAQMLCKKGSNADLQEAHRALDRCVAIRGQEAIYRKEKDRVFGLLRDEAIRRRGGKKKIGPNDPCPCGSGKKSKHCCARPAKSFR